MSRTTAETTCICTIYPFRVAFNGVVLYLAVRTNSFDHPFLDEVIYVLKMLEGRCLSRSSFCVGHLNTFLHRTHTVFTVERVYTLHECEILGRTSSTLLDVCWRSSWFKFVQQNEERSSSVSKSFFPPNPL